MKENEELVLVISLIPVVASEAHKQTPAMMLGLTDHAFSIGELLDNALIGEPFIPAPKRPRLTVIEGGKE